MKRPDWKYLVDTLLTIDVIGMAFIGILLGLVIPEGPSENKYFLGLHRHDWGHLHFWLALAFIVLIVVHLALNWDWIVCMAKNVFKKGWALGLIATVIMGFAVLGLLWLLYPAKPGAYDDHGVRSGEARTAARENAPKIEARTGTPAERPGDEPPDPGEGPAEIQEHDDREIAITGQMTIREIEAATGVAARSIVSELGLPAGVSLDDTLGRLRRQYGFSMAQAREIILKLQRAGRR